MRLAVGARSSAGQSIGLLIPDWCASVRVDARQYGAFRVAHTRANTLEHARTRTKSPHRFPSQTAEASELGLRTVKRVASELYEEGLLNRDGTGKRGCPFRFSRKDTPVFVS